MNLKLKSSRDSLLTLARRTSRPSLRGSTPPEFPRSGGPGGWSGSGRAALAAAAVTALVVASGCTSYPLARDTKLISFDDNIQKGKSVGPIEGEDCVWRIFGYSLGGMPTIDRALASARTQSKSQITDAVSSKKSTFQGETVRYLNNVNTSWDGFNAVVVGKTCLIVKGTGYR